ncbi:MAG TPA: hypothetical protein P5228_02720 [Bacteroidales bacterium]|nr:hypothetical protein [Bacteroidales bacterium]HRZ48867.1 hypothetical protein [Bacteroidales bacterium]
MDREAIISRNDRIKGMIAAILVLLLVFMLSLFFGFQYPDPPIPDEGVEIEMGGSGSSGGIEGQNTLPETEPVSRPNPEQGERTYVTDNRPDNPPAPVASPTVKLTQTAPVTQPETPKQKVNPNALFTKKGTSGSGGSGSSSGSGKGSGTGTKPGDGTGTGKGSGTGPSFSLTGRTHKELPLPSYNSDRQGKIVIDVNVDQQGNVVDAQYNSRLSTTSDLQLKAAAIEAAKRSRFSVNLDAPVVQRGMITYTFIKLN